MSLTAAVVLTAVALLVSCQAHRPQLINPEEGRRLNRRAVLRWSR